MNKNKITLITGAQGVGKTTLANKIACGLNSLTINSKAIRNGKWKKSMNKIQVLIIDEVDNINDIIEVIDTDYFLVRFPFETSVKRVMMPDIILISILDINIPYIIHTKIHIK